MNKKYRITQKILGALTLASGVTLVFSSLSLRAVMIIEIFPIIMFVSAVITLISGSKLFNATTYDFFQAKIILSLTTIVSAFAAPLLFINAGLLNAGHFINASHNVIQFGLAIFFTIVLFVAPSILLMLTTKK